MKYKIKIYLILAVSFVAALISLVLGLPEGVGLCAEKDMRCIHDYIDRYNSIIQTAFIFSVPLFLISFMLLFLKEQIFQAWSKFAIVFIPISIILISITPTTGDSLQMVFGKESATFFLAAIFVIASVVLVIVKSLKLRGKGK